MDMQEVLKRLKEGKRAGGMAFKIFDGVAYVSREEVEKFEKDYWKSEQELKACREWMEHKPECDLYGNPKLLPSNYIVNCDCGLEHLLKAGNE